VAIPTGIISAGFVEQYQRKSSLSNIKEADIHEIAVHAQTAGEHQDQYDEHGGNDLIAFFIQYRSDDIEGIIPCIQAEQMEDPRHPQHPEDDHAGQEEKGYDIFIAIVICANILVTFLQTFDELAFLFPVFHVIEVITIRKKKGKIVSRSIMPSKEIRNRSRERNSFLSGILVTFLQTFDELAFLFPVFHVVEVLTILIFCVEYILRIWTHHTEVEEESQEMQ